jgi:hypothetical protein
MVESVNPSTSFTLTSTSTNTYTDTYSDQQSIKDQSSQSYLQDPENRDPSEAYPSDDEPPIPPPKDPIFQDLNRESNTSIQAGVINNETLQELAEMDVRELLAQCEDPTIGWASQFWVTIADPVVSRVPCPAVITTTTMIDRTTDRALRCLYENIALTYRRVKFSLHVPRLVCLVLSQLTTNTNM